MISLETIQIVNFRGIKKLTVDFGRSNHVIYGPNGTGKSGIVDAIEFVLTGSVTRLTGRGSGGISVRKHGPHVDFRNDPDKAIVTLTAYSPELKQTFTVTRSVGNPSKPEINPATPEVLELVTELVAHPEIALSRREILTSVIAEDGARSKEVQALLRLDSIETTRASLQKIVNDCKKRHQAGESEVNRAQALLLAILKIPQLNRQGLLDAVNERRALLGLQALAELKKDTNLRQGVAMPTQGKPALHTVKKATASADLNRIEMEAEFGEQKAVLESRDRSVELLRQLLSQPALLKDLRQRAFLVTGFEFIDGNLCPLCETEWDADELKDAVKKRIEGAKEAAQLKATLEQVSAVFRRAIDSHVALINVVKRYADQLGLLDCATELSAWASSLGVWKGQIVSGDDVAMTIGWMTGAWTRPPEKVTKLVGDLRKVVNALPEESVEEQAKEFLVICQERLEAVQSAQRNRELWKERQGTSEFVAREFETASKTALNTLYDDVEAEFSRYYALIHNDDEKQFLGELTPSLGKLSFNVDFYGKGKYPPGAYHSEGHQDSMGVCLYLALMKRTLGAGFRIAVLDDVLMSVDQGHRRDVCRLLKTEFPDTQFIVTTHDKVWLNHMLNEQLVTRKGMTEFRRWSVADGPFDWTPTEVWDDIEDAISNNDIPRAAHTLRFYLERMAGEISARLRGQVEYRVEQSYDPNELLTSAIGRFPQLLKKGVAAAHSWGDAAIHAELVELEKTFSARVEAKHVVSWMLNPSVHYNEWNNLAPNEFRALGTACRDLVASFSCPKCNGLYYVEPKRGSGTETLRCDCRAINLKSKPKAVIPAS